MKWNPSEPLKMSLWLNNFFQFFIGEVVGIDTCVIDFLESYNHWVTNTTRFICSRDGCNLVVPIGFFAFDADLAASLNIKKLGRRVVRRRNILGRRYKGFTPLLQ